MEYSHRTYDHFIQMFPVIYTKIKQDEEKAPSIDLETLERQLVQATVVIDLLFMSEISKAMAVSSKALQKFDVLPFEAMYIINKLKSNLQDAHSAFEKNACPNVVNIDGYKLWDFFTTSSKTIRETQHFKDVPLLVPADRGRVTRSSSQLQYGYEPDSFGALIKSRYALYAKLLNATLDALKRRFEPWPKWLIKCNVAFNFSDVFFQTKRGKRHLAICWIVHLDQPLFLPKKKTDFLLNS